MRIGDRASRCGGSGDSERVGDGGGRGVDGSAGEAASFAYVRTIPSSLRERLGIGDSEPLFLEV